MADRNQPSIETLTRKIHDKADKDLLKSIDDDFDRVLQKYSNTYVHKVNNKDTGELAFYAVVRSFKKTIFENHKHGWRDKYVKEFMSKVEDMEEMIAEYMGE